MCLNCMLLFQAYLSIIAWNSFVLVVTYTKGLVLFARRASDNALVSPSFEFKLISSVN